eukprot:285495-Rhodomonas_salina.1
MHLISPGRNLAGLEEHGAGAGSVRDEGDKRDEHQYDVNADEVHLGGTGRMSVPGCGPVPHVVVRVSVPHLVVCISVRVRVSVPHLAVCM